MKYFFVLALVTSAMFGVLPAAAADIKDVVRANCTKHLVSSTDVTRNAVKTFQVVKIGGGYVMRGPTETGQTATCETDGDGIVTWVKVS